MAKLGEQLTDEVKKKISLALKNRWKIKKYRKQQKEKKK